MEKIVEIPPRYWIRVKLIQGVVFAEELHTDHSEYIDHDHKNEGEITQGADCRYDNTKEDFHRGPRLRELKDSQQPKSPYDGESIDQFKSKIDQRRGDDYKVEYIPAVVEEIFTQGQQFQETFKGEYTGENFIPDVQSLANAFAHPVMFHRQKSGVQNDAQGNGQLK